jgi:hypothetical protein
MPSGKYGSTGSTKLFDRLLNIFERKHIDPIRNTVALLAGINHPELFQIEIIHDYLHAFCGPGRDFIFKLEAVPFSFSGKQQIEFRVCMGLVEISVSICGGKPNDFLQSESLPGKTQLGMRPDFISAPQTQKGVEDAGVPEIDFGGLPARP